MRNKMLRSVLVAAFSAVAALGVLGGLSGAKDDVRANSSWPSVAVGAESVSVDTSAGSAVEGVGD